MGDNVRENGTFILKESYQPDIHQAVSQTLAGGISVLRFFPFFFPELNAHKIDSDFLN